MSCRSYPSDLSDKEWSLLEPMLKLPKKRRGPKRKWPFRRVLDAIFYTLKTGCQWRYLPADFPPWQTAYYHFRQWKRKGLWFQLHEKLRLQKIWADAGYVSQALSDWCAIQGWQLETVHREEVGFTVLPRRWIVERTFAWLFKFRRLCFDFERTVQSSEYLIIIAMSRLMLKRLAG